MNFNELKELIQVIDQSGLNSFQYQKDGLKLKVEKINSKAIAYVNQSNATPSVEQSSAPIEKIQNTEASAVTQPIAVEIPTIEGNLVKSPLVGVYYASPTPTSAPYVTVGQQVKVGDTLCIVEAMKVMNEITAEFEGVVLEICPTNESLVEYGQPLVRIG